MQAGVSGFASWLRNDNQGVPGEMELVVFRNPGRSAELPYVTRHVTESDYFEMQSAISPRGNKGQCQKRKVMAKLEKAFKPTEGLKHTPDEVVAKNA